MTTSAPTATRPQRSKSPAGESDLRVAVRGVALVALGYLAMAVFAAATLPWRGTADAFNHLDYVYQLLQGQLPGPIGHEWVPADGTVGPPATGRQWVSQHPPLFYVLVAPLAAPFLDGNWPVAVALIRGANILVGLSGVVVLAWLGWMLGGRWRARLAIAVPAAGTATFAYVRYAAEVYNDTLLTTLSLLALALLVRTVLRGISVPPLLLLAVVCVLGLGTKATFVLTLGVVAAGLLVAALVHADGRRARALATGVAAAAAVAVPPVLVWGWFYARNAALSGSWYQTTSDDVQVLDRRLRSTGEVLADPDFYLLVPTDLVGDATLAFDRFADRASGAVFAVAAGLTLAVLILAVVSRRLGGGRFVRPATLLATALVLGHLVGSYLVQLSHASGYGAYNWRYFMPSTAAVALILGLGAASLGRLSAVALPALVVVLSAANAASYVDYGVDKASLAVDPRDVMGAARALALQNDLPGFLPAACLAVALASSVGLGILVARNRKTFGATTHPGPPTAG